MARPPRYSAPEDDELPPTPPDEGDKPPTERPRVENPIVEPLTITAAELTFYQAVAAAESARQAAYAAAFATYAFVPANYVAYRTALDAANVAYDNAVATARSATNLPLLMLGSRGPIDYAYWAATGALI